MKAVVFSSYGSPDVLRLTEISKPQPGPRQVCIRIKGTAVNRGDLRLRSADPWAVRLFFGFFRPRKRILGGTFSGVVEEVGNAVTRYKPGDHVFGSTGMAFGAYAEYICLPENGLFTFHPGNITDAEAAAVPFGVNTALYFLRKAGIKPGQRVLVYGASGAVGSAAVQLAAIMGAEVTAVCSGRNAEWIKSLGAAHVLNYQYADWKKGLEPYDVVMETVDKLPLTDCAALVRKGGYLVLGAAMMGDMLSANWLVRKQGKKLVAGLIRETREAMEYIAGEIREGRYKPVVDKQFQLEEMVAAHHYAGSPQKRGNVAVVVN